MKLAHISDLHICHRYRRENIVHTELLLKRALSENIEHLFIAGDISHDSQTEDFLIFRDLLKKYGFLDSSRASISIGNHDIYGGVHLATDIITFPKRCKTTSMTEKVNEFANSFSELFENTVCVSDDVPFPYAKTLGNLAIFGLNTNMKYSTLRNPLASNGKLDSTEWAQLKELLNDTRFDNRTKIVLCHHHFNNKKMGRDASGGFLWQQVEKKTMRLYGVNRLARFLAKNDVKLVLHGHVHYNDIYMLYGTTFVNGGGCVESDIKDGFSRINLITVEKDKIEAEIVNVVPDKIRINPHPVPVFEEYEMEPLQYVS